MVKGSAGKDTGTLGALHEHWHPGETPEELAKMIARVADETQGAKTVNEAQKRVADSLLRRQILEAIQVEREEYKPELETYSPAELSLLLQRTTGAAAAEAVMLQWLPPAESGGRLLEEGVIPDISARLVEAGALILLWLEVLTKRAGELETMSGRNGGGE